MPDNGKPSILVQVDGCCQSLFSGGSIAIVVVLAWTGARSARIDFSTGDVLMKCAVNWIAACMSFLAETGSQQAVATDGAPQAAGR
jgi:hypothetical protein